VSGHPLLTAAARAAVKQWIYEPALIAGEPVRVEIPIEVPYHIGPDLVPTPRGKPDPEDQKRT
jgi:outer membrane biosynthesis protein TonB